MPQVHPELTFRALSHLLIVFLGLIPIVFSLVSMWKENRFGWPLRGIIWFTGRVRENRWEGLPAKRSLSF